MDYYNRKKIENLVLTLYFIVALVLQVVGHKVESYFGLVLQLISVLFLIVSLYLYNKRYK